jgi:DNA-binding XRE family transcriptional regulator
MEGLTRYEPQIVRTPAGEELVIIPRAEYERLLAAAMDDADAVATYDARMAELAAEANAILPAAVSLEMLKGASRFKALRRWRGLSQTGLAAKADLRQGYLSEIENRRKIGSAETLAKLAKALDVPLQWLT